MSKSGLIRFKKDESFVELSTHEEHQYLFDLTIQNGFA